MDQVITPGIDFAALSSLLRVISTSPPWDEASLGIQRLTTIGATGKAYDARARDEQNVRGFARLLREDADLIYRAILCGAYAGRLVDSPSEAERIIRGLQSIKVTYRFDEKTEAGVRDSLDVLLKEIREYYRDEVPVAGRPLQDVSGVRGWVDSLKVDLRTIRGRAPMGMPFSMAGEGRAMLSLDQVQSGAWSSALKRLDAMFTGRGTDLRAGIEELMCDAARIPPGSIVRLRPEAMGVVEWSEALRQAIERKPAPQRPAVPSVVAPIALHALGFALRDDWLGRLKAAVNANDPDVEATRKFVADRPWMLSGGDGPSVVIVRRPADSLIDSWSPSSRAPAIAATYDHLRTFTENDFFLPARFPALPVPLLVAVEAPQEVTVTTGDEWQRRLVRSLGDKAREIRFYPSAPRQQPNGPYIVEPRSVEDLVSQALSLHTWTANAQS